MNKKLKLFGLLALALALGATAAWAFTAPTANPLPLVGENDKAITMDNNRNEVIGNGSLTGGMTGAAANSKILNLDAAEGNTITLAPAATFRFAEAAGQPVQVLVNQASDKVGKVVIKASNGDNPSPGGADMTNYTGGTVQMHGVLGVTNNNSLGQRWVGVFGNLNETKAPVFQVEGVDKVYLGVNDPTPAQTQQPFYLMFDNTAGGDPLTNLTYVKVNADAVSTKLQGLWLMHGLDQVGYTVPNPFNVIYGGAANDTLIGGPLALLVDGSTTGYVRLIKQGKGSLFINGDTAALEAAPMALPYDAVDGAHHRGGTVVEAGVLQVDGGNAAVRNDHFRGSLGKVWSRFQGSASTMANPYDPASYLAAAVGVGGNGALYNPLFILNDAKVMVNRSQFFSDFNVAKDATFYVDEYTLASVNYNPQIAVTLDRKDSTADGLLEGKFDLVLNSVVAASRPTNDPTSPAITHDSQAIFFIDNAENKIFDAGETLVANGVLEIAGAKSIGGGQVTIGATGGNGLPDRGFLTPNPVVGPPAVPAGLATFASSKTFKLENVTVGQDRGAVAVERGETLSFKDITLKNKGTAAANSFRINPVGVSLGDGYNNTIVTGDPFAGTNATLALPLPGNWTDSATVVFGAADSADAKYSVEGVMRNPTRVDVERGVLQLNAFPVPVPADQKPFMNVYVYPTAVLSLGKDVNDFSPYMDLKVTDDSRIRLVLRDSDIAATRAEAMAKEPVFQANHVDYTALGAGAQNKDRRLNIQLDPSQLTGGTVKKGWVKLVFSPDAKNWNHLHYLREYTPGLTYEDYAKVRITWTTTSDIVKNAVAHVDQNSYTILVEVGEDVTDPVNPGTPVVPEKDLKATVTAPATVKVGASVTFELGKWSYKASDDVEVQDVVWTLDGVDKTADVAGDKLTVTASAEGTMNLVVTSKLVADPTVDGEAKASVTVTKDGGGSGGSSGGCDAGFGGLALALGALFLLKKRA